MHNLVANTLIMQHSRLYKLLIDVLFVIHIIYILGFLMLPIITVFTVQGETGVYFQWYDALFKSLLAIPYVLFALGLLFLRRTSRDMIDKQYFSNVISINIKKAGKCFLLFGCLMLLGKFLMWILVLYAGKFSLGSDDSLVLALFSMMIGTFFILQSNALDIARDLREENALTV